MCDYVEGLPSHTGRYIGEHDLFVEIFEGKDRPAASGSRPPLLFVHGAFTGSWMWSKYIPHFVDAGWDCYVMNLRSHYRSRVLDMSAITFEDYLDDIRTVIAECGAPPILIGFSMGGILGQKLAESIEFAGLVLIDSVISREVHDAVPYGSLEPPIRGPIVPAPVREERTTIDESEADIAFQRKYLAMEAAKAFNAFVFSPESNGISIDAAAITCPCLVVKAANNEEDDRRGRATAEQFRAEYKALWNMTHTGVLIGQRYKEAVDAVLAWLQRV